MYSSSSCSCRSDDRRSRLSTADPRDHRALLRRQTRPAAAAATAAVSERCCPGQCSSAGARQQLSRSLLPYLPLTLAHTRRLRPDAGAHQRLPSSLVADDNTAAAAPAHSRALQPEPKLSDRSLSLPACPYASLSVLLLSLFVVQTWQREVPFPVSPLSLLFHAVSATQAAACDALSRHLLSPSSRALFLSACLCVCAVLLCLRCGGWGGADSSAGTTAAAPSDSHSHTRSAKECVREEGGKNERKVSLMTLGQKQDRCRRC